MTGRSTGMLADCLHAFAPCQHPSLCPAACSAAVAGLAGGMQAGRTIGYAALGGIAEAATA